GSIRAGIADHSNFRTRWPKSPPRADFGIANATSAAARINSTLWRMRPGFKSLAAWVFQAAFIGIFRPKDAFQPTSRNTVCGKTWLRNTVKLNLTFAIHYPKLGLKTTEPGTGPSSQG
ncbi:hypothetical protein AB4144_47000, partial [Rhizobiaceae sp. 2RAB30]